MALPHPDPQFDFPYDQAPEGNSGFINNNTDASLIDDKIRQLLADTAQALRKASANIDYLDQQGVTVNRAVNQDIQVYFDAAARKGEIVFPVDVQTRDGVDYITVRPEPQPGNATGDAIAVVPADTEVGVLAPVRARGFVKGILWPVGLTPPTAYQRAVIEYDADDGWRLVDPVDYGIDIVRAGQKLIGFYTSYDEGPPATVDMFLTGFQQSNLNAPPNVVYNRARNNSQYNRISSTVENRDRFDNIITAAITPVRSRRVKVTVRLWMDFLTSQANSVFWDITGPRGSLLSHPVRETQLFRQSYYDASPSDVPGTYPSAGAQGAFTHEFEILDEEANLGEVNNYAFRFRNETRNTLVLRNTFMRLEEIL